MDGQFHPCGYSGDSSGNWKQDGVEKVWHGDAAKRFRQKIAAGELPNADCERCFRNDVNCSRIMHPMMGTFERLCKTAKPAFPRHRKLLAKVAALRNTFSYTEINDEIRTTLHRSFAALDKLERLPSAGDRDDAMKALRKLRVIGSVFRSYFEADPAPPIAPSRQNMLIAVCNARCIQCSGLHTGSIRRGVPVDGQFVKQMTPEETMRAFERPDDSVSFFMTGSEFLLFRHWREVAELLAIAGVKIALSTNGMLLTEENVDWLLDHGVLRQLNVRLDGGTRDTIERIRKGVKYDKVIGNIRYLIKKASEVKPDLQIDIGFILMKSNFTEVGELVKAISESEGYDQIPNISINLRPLFAYQFVAYRPLFEAEHHSRIDQTALTQALLELQQVATACRVNVNVLGLSRLHTSPDLDAFVEEGMLFPPPPEVLRGTRPAAAAVPE